MARILLLTAIALLALACSVASRAQNAADTKSLVKVPIADARSYAKCALVIGINDYRGNLRLHVCGNDAKDFAAMLRDKYGFASVVLMTDDPDGDPGLRPTQRNIEAALDNLYGDVIAGRSEVVFFYSGHGTRAKDAAGVDADWLVPEDFELKDVPGTCVNFDQIRQKLDTLQPRRVLLLTDACRDLLGKGIGSEGYGKSIHAGLVGEEVAQMQSCKPTESSLEGLPQDFQESVFTHFLIKGMSGDPDARDDRGNVTFDSLMEYVQFSVRQYASKISSTQTPDGRATLGSMVLAHFDTPVVVPLPAPAPAPIVTPVPVAPVPVVPAPEPIAPVQVAVPGKPYVNPKDGAELLWIAPGPFQMGDDDISDNPRHTVTLSGYWMYKNDVTVAMYRKFCQATGRPMPFEPAWGRSDDNPVVYVSWDDARAYCDWAGVHLPTEAQWEKAARGTDGRKYPWGNDWDASRLKCSRNSVGDAGSTALVGSFASGASPYGCLDMAGNVYQWCADWYDADYWRTDHGTDPAGPGSEQYRVLRGGSWFNVGNEGFRAADRYYRLAPADSLNVVGFRGSSGP